MNQDFHYNATYFAAVIAGYSPEEALTIAHAAQFVDDCIADVMPENSFVAQIPTCEDAGKLFNDFSNPAPYKINDIMARRRIWSYFHFLPGNFDGEVKYEGLQNKTAVSTEKWSYEYAGAEAFKLMCLPSSEMSKKMVADLLEKAPTASNSLEFIGLRMHVLADTWAHSYFSGSPDQCVNDVLHGDGMYEIEDGNKKKIAYVETIGDKIVDDIPSAHYYGVVEIDSPRFVSPVYAGHGRVGHLPDYAYCEYSYVPVWKDSLQGDLRYHTKKNQEIFLNAFKQLVAVMTAIKNNKPYEMGKDLSILSPEIENDIKAILKIRKIDISHEWNNLTQRYYGHTPTTYDLNFWINEYKAKVGANDSTASQSHYVKFTEAARSHYDWIEPIITEKLKVKSIPFVINRDSESDIYMTEGVFKPDEALSVKIGSQGGIYAAGMLPGIENIRIVSTEKYETDNPYEKEMKKNFEYALLVRGGCPKSYVSTSLEFKDRTGDSYSLSLICSDTKNHTVFYNSTSPEIVKISMHINASVAEAFSSEGGKLVDAASEMGEQALKAGEEAGKKVLDNVVSTAENIAEVGEKVGKSIISGIGKLFGR